MDEGSTVGISKIETVIATVRQAKQAIEAERYREADVLLDRAQGEMSGLRSWLTQTSGDTRAGTPTNDRGTRSP